jgi:Tfp pilus assembly protein PilN
MTRFSYRPTRREPSDRLWAVLQSLDQLRTPTLVAAASLVFLAVLYVVEQQRLKSLNLQLIAAQAELASVTTADVQVQRIAARVVVLRYTRERLDSWRRSTRTAANTVAALGNALPSRAWLTAVQSTADGSLSISGRSAQIVDVGSALRRLQTLDTSGQAQLVSISSDRRRLGVSFVISWQHPQ